MCLPCWPGPVLHLMLAGQKGISPVSLCVAGFLDFGCSLAETSFLDYRCSDPSFLSVDEENTYSNICLRYYTFKSKVHFKE